MKRTTKVIYKATLNWMSNLFLWLIFTAFLFVLFAISKLLCVGALVVTFIFVLYNNA